MVEKNPALCEREGVEMCLGCISGFANCNVICLGQLGVSSAERRATEFCNSNWFRCDCVTVSFRFLEQSVVFCNSASFGRLCLRKWRSGGRTLADVGINLLHACTHLFLGTTWICSCSPFIDSFNIAPHMGLPAWLKQDGAVARAFSTPNLHKNKVVGPWTHQKLRSECSLSLRHLTVQVPCPPQQMTFTSPRYVFFSVALGLWSTAFLSRHSLKFRLSWLLKESCPYRQFLTDLTDARYKHNKNLKAGALVMPPRAIWVCLCVKQAILIVLGRHMDSCCIIWYKFKAEGNHPHVSEDTYEASQANIRSRDVSIAMSYAFLKYEKAFCSRSWNGACRTTMRQLRKCEGEETVFSHFPRDFHGFFKDGQDIMMRCGASIECIAGISAMTIGTPGRNCSRIPSTGPSRCRCVCWWTEMQEVKSNIGGCESASALKDVLETPEEFRR